MRGIKTEHAIIEHNINMTCIVFITNSCMSKQRVNLATRSTSKQAELNAIPLLSLNRQDNSRKQA